MPEVMDYWFQIGEQSNTRKIQTLKGTLLLDENVKNITQLLTLVTREALGF